MLGVVRHGMRVASVDGGESLTPFSVLWLQRTAGHAQAAVVDRQELARQGPRLIDDAAFASRPSFPHNLPPSPTSGTSLHCLFWSSGPLLLVPFMNLIFAPTNTFTLPFFAAKCPVVNFMSRYVNCSRCSSIRVLRVILRHRCLFNSQQVARPGHAALTIEAGWPFKLHQLYAMPP